MIRPCTAPVLVIMNNRTYAYYFQNYTLTLEEQESVVHQLFQFAAILTRPKGE